MHFQVAAFFLAAIAVVSGTEELIGTLPNEQHDIGGSLYVVDSRTLRFEDFDYDGGGPGAFLYYYRPGVAVNRNGGGIIIPLPSSVGQSGGTYPGSFQRRRFINVDFTVTLPAGTDVCDIGTLTIWCQPFRAIFTRITIGRDIFVNNGADPCTLLSQVPPTTLPPTTLPPTTLPPTTLVVPVEILIGDLPNEQHGIDGNLYVVDSRTLRFEDFDYDGQGPGTFLYYYRPGVAVNRNGGGIIIPLPSSVGQSGGTRPGSFQRRRFTNEDFTVTLPAGTDVCDIGTLTIWCQPFRAIFTRITIRRDIFVNNGADPCTLVSQVPLTTLPPTTLPPTTTEAPVTTVAPPTTTDVLIGDLPNEQHGIDGNLYVVDSRTLRFENFDYDGQAPGTFLYYYRPGVAVNRNGGGTIIPLPSGIGQTSGTFAGSFQRRRFTNEDFTVTLPVGTDVCDIGTLIIWSQPFRAIFTRITIGRDIFENNGADPCTLAVTPTISPPVVDFTNCIPLHETLQLSWRVESDNSKIRFRLCGCQSEIFGTNQYMGFGLSGSDTQTLMFGADPTITWVDSLTGEANAVDYHLSAYTQCRAGVGACPDTLDSKGTCTNDITDVTGFATQGQQCVFYTKPLSTSDSTCDIPIDPTNENQYIVWGVGGLGETAFRHFLRAQSSDAPIHFGRSPRDECAGIPLACMSCPPFKNERIIVDENIPLQVRIGPSGNERGYMGITGRAGWGIAWYINGTLIPELVVERGKTYTFLIEGGDAPNDLSNYHPFYITDSISGGRLQNSVQNQGNETVYAGFDETGDPIGVGELCSYIETLEASILRENCATNLTVYTNSLGLVGSCSSGGGKPGRLVWTPDVNTPDVVYYQCATHLNLGWRITVTGAVTSTAPPMTKPTDTTITTTEEPVTEPPSVPPTSETNVTNVHALCSVVVWEYSSTENLIGYDIRFLNFNGTQVFVQRVQSTRAFYIVGDKDTNALATSSTLLQVQVRARYSDELGPWTAHISLGCTDPPLPPTCPPCVCDDVTTSSPQQRPGLYLKGRNIHNNSEIQVGDIGEGEDALLCLTDNEDCCGTRPNRRGQFYYPSGAQVPIRNGGQGFYRNRGDQLIRLNRRDTVSTPKGRFCCEIPDANKVNQKICITLV